MKNIVKVIPQKTGYKGRNISMGVDGSFLLSKELADEVKNILDVKLDFYQDADNVKDWYIEFSRSANIPLRLKSDGITYCFYSVEMRKKILNSIGSPIVAKRVKIVIGKSIVSKGITLYPVVTQSILNQI